MNVRIRIDLSGYDSGNTLSEETSAGNLIVEPTADGLDREEELDSLNDDLLSNIHFENINISESAEVSGDIAVAIQDGVGMSEAESNEVASTQLFLNHPKPTEESEAIRKWKMDFARRLQQKDEVSTRFH